MIRRGEQDEDRESEMWFLGLLFSQPCCTVGQTTVVAQTHLKSGLGKTYEQKCKSTI